MWKGAKSDLSDLAKWHLEWFRQPRLLAVHYSTPPGKLYAKIGLLNSFGANASKCKKSKIWPYQPWKMTFRVIQPKSIFRYVIYVTPKKSHAKKEEKSQKRFWDRPLPPQSWRTDGQTDGRTHGGPTTRHWKSSAAFRLAELKTRNDVNNSSWCFMMSKNIKM